MLIYSFNIILKYIVEAMWSMHPAIDALREHGITIETRLRPSARLQVYASPMGDAYFIVPPKGENLDYAFSGEGLRSCRTLKGRVELTFDDVSFLLYSQHRQFGAHQPLDDIAFTGYLRSLRR